MDKFSLVMIILLLVILFMLGRNYTTDLTRRTYLIGVFLYICFSIVYVAIGSDLTGKYLSDKMSQNWMLFLIPLFLVACVSVFIINNNPHIYITHIAFIVLLTALSFMAGPFVNYSTRQDLVWAAGITGSLILVLTFILFYLPDDLLNRISQLSGRLTWLLFCIIIIELVGAIFLRDNAIFRKILNYSVIMLFVLFIMADTSNLVLQCSDLPCDTHTCINYPSDSLNLFLDYFNIFLRALRLRRE